MAPLRLANPPKTKYRVGPRKGASTRGSEFAESLFRQLPDLDAGDVGVAAAGLEVQRARVAEDHRVGSQLVPVAGGPAVVALQDFLALQEDVVDLVEVV